MSFWSDNWACDFNLNDVFLPNNNMALLMDFWAEDQCDFFSINLAMGLYADRALANAPGIIDDNDRIIWRLVASGIFTT